ncbi:MAG TPA: c-type cytochrome [Vicinamibacterales bacterium]|nr:c-type cytochrome [Vicinamibacterales bacterium]
MKKFFRIVAFVAFLFVLGSAAVMFLLQGRGVSARPAPSWIETRLALFMRGWMTPSTYKGLQNPVSNTQENFLAAREHFADHCASCHANDGSGNTEMGRNLYPKAPDMRLPRTQTLSDGELFYIIENGVMLTGMPGWSTGTPEGEKSSWQLVHFIRRLPSLTPEDLEEMKKMNPVSGVVLEEERRIQEFLEGSNTMPANKTPADPHAGHKPPQ